MEVRARCPENEDLARFIWEKRESLIPKDGSKEKLDATITKAFKNVCECKHPITSLRDASQISGVGTWMLKQLKEFFVEPASSQQEPQEASPKAKDKGKKRYVPQKSSAPYAILLTLYKALKNGKDYMKKQELIDAADASGLSSKSIQPNNAGGPPAQFGYGTKDWYSGWTTMKTLVSKGLVVKSSCPAKYMLTEEGVSTAEECLHRSGMQIDSINTSLGNGPKKSSSITPSPMEEDSPPANNSTIQKSRISPIKAVPNYRGNTLVHDSKKSAYAQDLDDVSSDSENATWHKKTMSKESILESSKADAGDNGSNSGWLNLPPLKYGETFLSAYCVVLLLDDRERFMSNAQGNSRDKVAEQLRCQFQIEVETRHLPIGDTLWIARHKVSGEEYILDFIIERKKVSDLLHSIRDTRYKQQKLRLLRCGLRKLIYVVEGDPNVMDSAESIKTACFTTEIAEGFDVQRTLDVRDTMKRYGHLTHAISTFYNDLSSRKKDKQGVCRTYKQFVEDCKDLEKEKVSDVFGVMLMQVKQVTENIALSILQRYPTPLSLVSAYSRLKGDEKAQENLLKGIPIINQNKEISSIVSKKIFQFICSPEAV